MTSDLNQWLALAVADRLPVTVGLVSSTLTVVSSVAELPALSVAVPWTFCAAPSPLVTGDVQPAMPEPPSVQVKVTVTSLLFQPAALATGDCVWLMPGAVLSIFTSTFCWASTLPATSTLHTWSVWTPSVSIVTLVPVAAGCWSSW